MTQNTVVQFHRELLSRTALTLSSDVGTAIEDLYTEDLYTWCEVSERKGADGATVEPVAICVRDDGGWSSATGCTGTAECVAG